jgi:hypothetical protein
MDRTSTDRVGRPAFSAISSRIEVAFVVSACYRGPKDDSSAIEEIVMNSNRWWQRSNAITEYA